MYPVRKSSLPPLKSHFLTGYIRIATISIAMSLTAFSDASSLDAISSSNGPGPEKETMNGEPMFLNSLIFPEGSISLKSPLISTSYSSATSDFSESISNSNLLIVPISL